jgi:hypothetical protein
VLESVAEGARRLEKVLAVVMVGSSAVSCVTWDRGGCNLLRRARQREMRLSVGAIVSSVAVCVACVVVTATVAPERKLSCVAWDRGVCNLLRRA